MSIEVNNVTKVYGVQKALDDVSFEISTGEVVGFLGPNGAGKSTMMKIITCYLPPTMGSVKVCGNDVLSESINVREQVGYLPEHNPLYLDMYVKEYLTFIGRLYKVPNLKSRVGEMISMVGLEREQRKRIEELSKGYRQRVGLAQAMIHKPKVLILDEPTSGLDPNQLVEIRKLINEIGQNTTIMLSTHIMQEVEATCNRVMIINKGVIVADTPANELSKYSEGTSNVLIVEFESEIEERQLRSIDGVGNVIKLPQGKWEIHSKSGSDVRQKVFKWAVDNNVTILTIQQKEKSLEDIFKQVTSK